MDAPAPAETTLRAEREGPVLVLTLDGAGSRNAISPPIYRAVQAAVIGAGQDESVRAIVLTGADGFFSSGGNIHNLKKSAASTMAEVTLSTDALNAMIKAVVASPVPVIAAVEGGAAGAGCSLALACDMIVAAEGARFTVAYVKVGLTPDGGVTHFLASALPKQLVTEMCLLGRPVSATRLEAAGVVNLTTPEGGALDAAKALAAELAVGPAQAISVIKSEIAATAHNDLSTHLDLEAQGVNRARFGAEAREGLAAFLEKRKPDFSTR